MIKRIKFIIILLLIVFAVGLIIYARGINSPVEKNGQDKIFIVNQGESVNRISKNLLKEGLIKSKFYFEVYVWREKKESVLQAGEYVLNSGDSIKEIVRILSEGEAINDELIVKIIEGWKIDDIDNYLNEQGIMEEGEFNKMAKTPIAARSSIPLDFLKDAPGLAGLEGYLFPDTYRIFKDERRYNIINKMLNNFDQRLTSEMREDIEKQGKTIYEIVKMASLVEKEVRTPKDMKIVSGIFWDRIKNGQALESCATLAYVLGVNKPQYTIKDTQIDSPYNTYRNQGLPPTPISNPGLNAIKAAIYPEYTNYNYFLSRPDTGETVFSATYDEHLRNKAKYLD